ncbi:MAG TPA: hypothetical protein PKA63_05980 [Oligoflexia bacterium]|nr:hypothetical protein [Oligoflexia bacterium]HMP48199.1 hypothetical protein [Oligoflexia bacterium]
MPDAGLGIPKTTTLVAAAMETAGAYVQSDMLDYIGSATGQTIAGGLYLVAIIGAIITLASGGSYRWGRYLVIGPTLFFFLTTVRTQSDGTEWSFGNKTYDQSAVKKALTGIIDNGNAGGTGVRVSIVYHFWNVFMSEVVARLIDQLNLTEKDSQYNFISKVERYMNGVWNFSQINDPDLRLLIKVVMGGQCRPYFDALRESVNQNSSINHRRVAGERAELLKKKIVFITHEVAFMGGDFTDWMNRNNLEKTTYTCDSLWKKLIPILRGDVSDSLTGHSQWYHQPGQNPVITRELFQRKFSEYVERAEGKVNFNVENAASFAAIDWIIARSMWDEIFEVNRHTDGFTMGNFSALHQEDAGSKVSGGPGSYNADVTEAIQQFNFSEKYGQRSEFVNAALSLPHFQGAGFLLLSAAFPFFALMVLIPGRAAAIFTWFGLWTWLKLWDLGFAVVMMIDNMLYSMFPRGPNLKQGEIENLGIAWTKVFELDPNYALATYYNLIATCMFAVPMVTAVFVKGGGNELSNLINQSMVDYSSRIAGAPIAFARSKLAQSYMEGSERKLLGDVAKAQRTAEINNSKLREELDKKVLTLGLVGGVKKLLGNRLGAGLAVVEANLDSEIQQLENKMKAEERMQVAATRFNARKTYSRYAANRAVASRYYSHELNIYSPYQEFFGALQQGQYFERRNIGAAGANTLQSLIQNTMGAKK